MLLIQKTTSKASKPFPTVCSCTRATQATAEHLQRAKELYGENSTVVAKLESKLRSQQITEQQLANSIKQTSESLKQARDAEQERTSETAKATQN